MKKAIFNISLVLLFVITNKIFSQTTDLVSSKDTSKTDTVTFVMKKSPWGAVLRSAIVPGWGQIYNESYYKAPIVWAISGWLIYNWVYNNRLYKANQTYYANSQYSSTRFRTNRDFYRDQRDLFTIYMSIAYAANLLDAYVDAHLFDFTVENNIMGPQIGIRLKLK